jgi:internalin A
MSQALKDLLRTLLARNRVELLRLMPGRGAPAGTTPRGLDAEAQELLDDFCELGLLQGDQIFARMAELFAGSDSKEIEACRARWFAEHGALVGARVLARLEQSLSSQELDLSGLDLEEFPRALLKRMGQLRHVRVLYLGQNSFTRIPAELARLPCRIHTLDLSNNVLTALSDEDIGVLQRMESLEHLRLTNCGVRSLPAAVAGLPLKSLSLAGNALGGFPAALCRMTSLEALDLSSNMLVEIPAEIAGLTHLRALTLAHCGVAVLPNVFDALSRLESLDLAGNALASLPLSIGWLRNLTHLDLQDNLLEVLPDSMRSLISALRVLKLHGNPGLRVPPEVLGSVQEPASPKSVLFYYFNAKTSKKLNEGKLILVGNGGVGKTSLVNRLLYSRFNPLEDKTPGVQIAHWDIGARAGARIRLHVWDFGGQEIMHATHQFFLTERALYIVVINCRAGQEDREIEYWLRLVTSFGGESPIVVVLNRIREHPTDLNYNALQAKYRQIVRFVKTDCRDLVGIDELKDAIRETVVRLPDIGALFPANWFVVKNRLSGMKEHYLSLAQYRAICDEYGVADRAAQDELAGYLHRLGIILHYRDDIRLRDTSVLSPQWVTSGVYKILNREELARQSGEFVEGHLSQWLPEADYPVEKHAFLIDLMRRFAMCIDYGGAADRYLIPDLLPKQEPPAIRAMFRPEGCINFEFRYEVLPEGLLPRFIARTYLRSEGQPRWRTGVVLALQGCHALVAADTVDRKVLVLVRGPASLRRWELFTIVREELERMHRQIPNLPVRAFIPLPDFPGHAIEFEKLRMFAETGRETITEYIQGRLIDLPVRMLLEGVDAPSLDAPGREADGAPPLVYCHYVQADADHAHGFYAHMRLYERTRALRVFRDLEQPDMVRERALRDATLVVVLVSAAVFDPDNARQLDRILQHCATTGIPAVPVLVRSCAVAATPFRDVVVLPRGNQAVDLSANEDMTWTVIAQEVRDRVVAASR